MSNHRFFPVLLIGIVLLGCHKTPQEDIPPLELDQVHVARFDVAFYRDTTRSIAELRQDFSVFLPEYTPDSIWEAKRVDTLELELFRETELVFGDFSSQKKDLAQLLARVKHHLPQRKTPKFYTLISEVDYNYSVIDADSLVVLGLDNFLGTEHPFYQGLPAYIKQTMKPSQLLVKIAAAIGRKAIEQRTATYLLDHMIAQGMVLHTQYLLWPEQNIQDHLGYDASQWDWIQKHEADLWRIFLDKAWLYATDQNLRINLLMPGPFSKFGLDMDREIPPMVGKYFGWKIVSSYAQSHPNLSLEAMLAMDARSLFESSGYKPAKSK